MGDGITDGYKMSRADVPEGARTLQEKVGERNSAGGQEVRMTLEDYRKAQGSAAVLRGPPVTLEGLAAVIGAIGSASVQSNHMLSDKDRHAITGDLVRLVRKAQELACGNPERPPAPCFDPECTRYAHGDDLPHIPGPHMDAYAAAEKARAEMMHAAKMHAADEAIRLYDATYNRAITDAHAAVGDVLGQKAASYALEAQAAIRRLHKESK